MKLFILAAGKGARLWPLTKNTPKSLLDLGDGTTLLERQINNAIDSGIFNEIIIITGYKSNQIEEKIKEFKDKIKIKTIFNPFYDIANNLISLWCAWFEMLNEDFMITNGDNIYKNHVIKDVFNSVKTEKEVIAITIDYKNNYDEDDMKVILDKNKNILKVHKEIPVENTNAESVGLAIIKGDKSRNIFVSSILEMVKEKETLNKFWLDIFNHIIEKGYPVKSIEIDADSWQEVDFHPDIETLKKLIIKKHFK